MSNDWQPGSEPPSAPTIIEDYQGPIIEQPKAYPANHQLVTQTPPPTQPEPNWVTDNRSLEKMTNFRRWLIRRTGEDNPIQYAAARGLGWSVLSVAMTTATLLIIALHQNIVPSTDSHFIYQTLNWNVIAIALAMTMLCALLITVPSCLVDALRVRSQRNRATQPDRVMRLSNMALVLTALVLVAIIITFLLAVMYFTQGGK